MPSRPPGTSLDPGFVRRAAAGIRYALTGKTPDWFGPAEPIAPAAQTEAAGRAFDYPAGYNLATQPRAGEPITFQQLRALADNYDLLRLCIETRKNQLAKMPWAIQRIDGADDDGTAERLLAFLRRPDQEHRFGAWQRMLVEDMLVIDAASLYVRPTKGGQLYALEVIDGATIKRVLGPDGRTPMPPAPAYQQVLKGLPAVDYARDELLYRPRNVRAHKVYGYSPVEQIVLLVNLALRRELFQLNYYTEGNIPDALMSVPASWGPKEIEDFQKLWDALMSDDLAAKRRIKFTPDGTKYIPTKTEKLFDEADEWLARVVCFCFSLPPTPFSRLVNRATSEQTQDTSLEEGVAPLQAWWKDLMDDVIQGPLGAPAYEFVWEDVQEVDPVKQAQIDDLNIKNGSRTVNEVRAQRGDPPIDPAEMAPPVPGGEPSDKDGATGDGAVKLVKRRSVRQRFRL